MDEDLRRARRQYFATFDGEDAARYIAALERAMGIAPPLHEYEIQNTLVASTSHISGEEADWLNAHEEEPWVTTNYCWIFWISEDDQIFESLVAGWEHLPNVAVLMRLAKSLNCEYLKIDVDGPVYTDLPTWEW